MIDAKLANDAKKFLGQFANMVNLIQTVADAAPDLAEIAALAAQKDKLATEVKALEVERNRVAEELVQVEANLLVAESGVFKANEEAAKVKALGVKAGTDALASAQEKATAIVAEAKDRAAAVAKDGDEALQHVTKQIAAANAELERVQKAIATLKAKFNG